MINLPTNLLLVPDFRTTMNEKDWRELEKWLEQLMRGLEEYFGKVRTDLELGTSTHQVLSVVPTTLTIDEGEIQFYESGSVRRGYTKLSDTVRSWIIGGLSYGECYGDHIGWTQSSAVQNTWYPISASGMVSDELNIITHNGSGQLTIPNAGVYKISYGLVITSSHANEHLHFGLEIDGSGTPHVSSHTHMETKFANQETSVAHTSLVTLTAGQTINAMIQTADAGTPVINVEDLHIVAIQMA